jgi:hypothetical protein
MTRARYITPSSSGTFRRRMIALALDRHISFNGCSTVMWEFQEAVFDELERVANGGKKVLDGDDMAAAIIAASAKQKKPSFE